jgi:lipopolysaccharide heptosyltransferase II
VSGARRSVRAAALQLAGRPVSAYGRLARRIDGRGHDGRGAPNILVVRPDHLGDVLLATPVARVLQEALPDAQIDWLVGPWSVPMARAASIGGEVLTLDFPGFTRQPKRSAVEPYALLLREAARLRTRSYDAALILRPDHWWGAMLVALAGMPRRFGFAVRESRPFLTDTLPIPTGHAVVANQALARLAALRLGGTVPDRAVTREPAFPIAAADAAWADAWRRRTDGQTPGANGAGRQGRTLVAIHPGTGAPVKNWLAECWAEVARELQVRHGARVVLTGGPGERVLIEEISSRVEPRPATLAGETTVGQLAALFSRCVLVVGGDSGPLHLAAAVGTPTVRLYGPTDVREFGPWPPSDRHVALVAGLPCQPCRNLVAPPCGATETPACMDALAPSLVLDAAGTLLVAGRSTPDVATMAEPS